MRRAMEDERRMEAARRILTWAIPNGSTKFSQRSATLATGLDPCRTLHALLRMISRHDILAICGTYLEPRPGQRCKRVRDLYRISKLRKAEQLLAEFPAPHDHEVCAL